MFRPSQFRTRFTDYLAASVAAAIIAGSLAYTPQLETGHGGDKMTHLAAYGLLSFLALVKRKSVGDRSWTIVAVIALGIVIEFVQPFVGREGEFSDVVANVAGVVLGCVAVAVVTFARRLI